jgi:hypothetical protein
VERTPSEPDLYAVMDSEWAEFGIEPVPRPEMVVKPLIATEDKLIQDLELQRVAVPLARGTSSSSRRSRYP